jgi:acyl dehydratase
VAEPVSHTITQSTIDTYAELSGDYNPLHVDPEYAGRSEFGSTIAHGPVGLQSFFELLARVAGTDWPPAGTHVEAVYRAPVRPGDTVTCEATTKQAGGGLELEAECRTAPGEIAVGVTATIPSAAS